MSEKKSLQEFATIDAAREANRKLAAQLARAKAAASERDAAVRACAELEDRVALLERLGDSNEVVPPWLVAQREKGRAHRATLMLLLSDCHFDEVVRPEEVDGANKFDRAIGAQRLQRVHDRVELIARKYFHGLTYDGVVILFGGDTLSGAIHEELVETNEDTVYGAIDYWSTQLAGFTNGLAEKFGQVHCVGVVGNHGRRTRKPVAKRRARDNLDWLLYKMIARATPNATWQIPESSDADVDVYTTRYRLTHGDQFHGGSGIAGMLSPIMLGQHRKSQQQMSMRKQPFDWLVMGHWHQYMHGRGIIVNGALKGYDEYAYVSNFRYEPAIQAFWATTPEHGSAFAAPIFCENRKKEGW